MVRYGTVKGGCEACGAVCADSREDGRPYERILGALYCECCAPEQRGKVEKARGQLVRVAGLEPGAVWVGYLGQFMDTHAAIFDGDGDARGLVFLVGAGYPYVLGGVRDWPIVTVTPVDEAPISGPVYEVGATLQHGEHVGIVTEAQLTEPHALGADNHVARLQRVRIEFDGGRGFVEGPARQFEPFDLGARVYLTPEGAAVVAQLGAGLRCKRCRQQRENVLGDVCGDCADDLRDEANADAAERALHVLSDDEAARFPCFPLWHVSERSR